MTGSTGADALFLAVCLAGYAGVVLVAMAARPEVGMLLTVGAMAITLNMRYSRTGEARQLSIGVHGVSVELLDVLALFMVAIAAARSIRRGSLSRAEVALWVLTAMAAVNVFRGFGRFPLQQVANEARPLFYLFATILFAASTSLTRRGGRLLGRGVLVYMCWLAVVASVGFATLGVRTVTDSVYVNGQLADPRPIAASGALVLAESLVLLLALRRRLTRLWVPAVAAVAVLLVLLQHRTLWVAAAAAIGWVMLRAMMRRGRGRRIAVPVAALASVLGFVVVATGVLRQSVLAASAGNALSDNNTLSWRFLGWQQLLAADRGLYDLLVGQPFGSGFVRVVDGVTLSVSAHSQYVSSLLRIGLVGVALVGYLLVAAWRSTGAVARVLGVSSAMPQAVLLLIVAYGVTYAWDPVQGLVLGLVLGAGRSAVAGAAGRTRGPSARPAPAVEPATAAPRPAGASPSRRQRIAAPGPR